MRKEILVSSALVALAARHPAAAQQAPPNSPQAQRVAAMVAQAAALVDKKGKAAFVEFRKPNSQWRFGHTYLFAYDTKLNVLLNAAFPQREGENIHGKTDINGVDYTFPKPGEKLPSQKWSYVTKVTVDGTPGVLGAGFYPD